VAVRAEINIIHDDILGKLCIAPLSRRDPQTFAIEATVARRCSAAGHPKQEDAGRKPFSQLI
jgi:hypothetical protein